MNRQRRRISLGLAATVLSGAGVARCVPQESNPPYFQSGRFQFTLLKPTPSLPSLVLFPLHGKAIDLASLRGRPILINFWATWCDACRIELPVLDRLAQRYRGSELAIVAIAEDRAERGVVERFAQKQSIRKLNIYLDPSGYVAFSDAENKRRAPFALYGMPITYAVTASARIIGYMPGAADWESADAGRLLEFLHNA